MGLLLLVVVKPLLGLRVKERQGCWMLGKFDNGKVLRLCSTGLGLEGLLRFVVGPGQGVS